MAGQVKKMIDRLIQEKAKGNEIIASSVRTKLILKGINVSKYTETSTDDSAVMDAVRQAAKEFGVML